LGVFFIAKCIIKKLRVKDLQTLFWSCYFCSGTFTAKHLVCTQQVFRCPPYRI